MIIYCNYNFLLIKLINITNLIKKINHLLFFKIEIFNDIICLITKKDEKNGIKADDAIFFLDNLYNSIQN